MGRTRRTFTAEEKLKVVMAVIQEGKVVSEVAKENMTLKKLLVAGARERKDKT